MSSMALFIEDYEELTRKVVALKELGLSIVMTQGVYDMFHTGHLRYFAKAKELGDILVVAVDTDELTKKRKGPNRPFDPEAERFEVVRSIRTVDIVVPKGADRHRYDVIKAVTPDVLVVSITTGPEIQKELKQLDELCGRVQNFPHQSSTTTTAKLRKLQVEAVDGVQHQIAELLATIKNGGNEGGGQT